MHQVRLSHAPRLVSRVWAPHVVSGGSAGEPRGVVKSEEVCGQVAVLEQRRNVALVSSM